jgi:CelD/BcsL family acetyltransferase involved in cellulose biosynthesis
VSFAGSWTQYETRTLKRHHRTNTRSRLNRLKAGGEVQLEIIRSAEALPAALEQGFALEAAAWKGTAGTAMLAREDTRQFYTSLAERFASSGLLNLVFLTLNGTRIAFAYGIRYQGRLYVLKTAYDPEHAKNSPYNVLCYLLYQASFEEGLLEYEFLGGSEDWKLNWATHAKRHHWLYVFAPTLRARALQQIKFGVVPWAEERHPRIHRALSIVKTIFA